MLWRVQQYQPVHQSRQSSLKPKVGSANPSPEPRDHQLLAWQCSELQPHSTPRLTARVPVRKAYRHRAYQGPDSRYDRWYRTSHTAAPPSTVMNSRRLMPSKPKDYNLPHRMEAIMRHSKMVCSAAALAHKQTFAVQKCMSALLPKADVCSAQAHVGYGQKADIG